MVSIRKIVVTMIMATVFASCGQQETQGDYRTDTVNPRYVFFAMAKEIEFENDVEPCTEENRMVLIVVRDVQEFRYCSENNTWEKIDWFKK